MADICKITSYRLIENCAIDSLLEDCIFIKGDHSDERDQHFESKLASSCYKVIAKYDTAKTELTFELYNFHDITFENDTEPVNNAHTLVNIIEDLKKTVVIDITGLSVEALFIILNNLKHTELHVYATYTEPHKYIVNNEAIVPRFELSESRYGYRDIPGFIRDLSSSEKQYVAFLGFEGGRFDELREQINDDKDIITMLPFPSYYSGWHMHVIYQNARTTKSADWIHSMKRITSWDPFMALSELEIIYHAYSGKKQIAVAPQGTKPHILATALFAIKNDDVEVMYDHPKVTTRRSEGIGNCFAYYLTGLL